MSRILKSQLPTKVWVSDTVEGYLNELKGKISETKNSVALREAIKIGLSVDGDGRYGDFIKINQIKTNMLIGMAIRLDENIDKSVKSYGGKRGLNLMQSYFDVICFGLSAFHFRKYWISPEKSKEIGSIIVADANLLRVARAAQAENERRKQNKKGKSISKNEVFIGKRLA